MRAPLVRLAVTGRLDGPARGGADVEPPLAGYTPTHRRYEWAGVALGLWFAAALALRVVRSGAVPLPAALASFVLGALLADLLSGAVHWAFDTWGTPRTAVLGPLAIRTFREHHDDESAMLRHDFIETNGHNFALSAVVSGTGLIAHEPWSERALLVAALLVAMTSQIHKWAHMPRPPAIVRALQSARLILPPAHHRVHHEDEHTRNYCITTGWLDGPLRVLRIWDALEAGVAAVTGARPRGEAGWRGSPRRAGPRSTRRWARRARNSRRRGARRG